MHKEQFKKEYFQKNFSFDDGLTGNSTKTHTKTDKNNTNKITSG